MGKTHSSPCLESPSKGAPLGACSICPPSPLPFSGLLKFPRVPRLGKLEPQTKEPLKWPAIEEPLEPATDMSYMSTSAHSRAGSRATNPSGSSLHGQILSKSQSHSSCSACRGIPWHSGRGIPLLWRMSRRQEELIPLHMVSSAALRTLNTSDPELPTEQPRDPDWALVQLVSAEKKRLRRFPKKSRRTKLECDLHSTTPWLHLSELSPEKFRV